MPFFGVDVAVLDPQTGKEVATTEASGVLAIRKPWPAMARTVYVPLYSLSPCDIVILFDLSSEKHRLT